MSGWWDDHSTVRSDDFAKARQMMVTQQLARRGIHEQVVLDALASIPREEFLPPERQGQAYRDGAQPIGQGQTISQPYMVAKMTELALPPKVASGGRLTRALEVGGGSGYQAAVLARLAEEVVSVERVPELAEEARRRLERLGIDNVEMVVGDGTLGVPERAPFDAIIVAAAAPDVPPSLRAQLAVGGRLVIPVGTRHLQELLVVHRAASGFSEERETRCVFVPLIGAEGWPEG